MRKFGIIICAIVIAAIAVILLFLAPRKDRKGPEINVPATISYHAGMSDAELLQGVTATDKRDGDVSDTLIVTSVLRISEENAVKITYAAQDRSNNISEMSVVVYYDAAASTEEVNVPDAEIDETNTGEDETDGNEITDEPDGGADTGDGNTENVGENPDNAGENDVTDDGDAQAGDTPDEGQADIINTNPAAPVLTLTDSEVSITRGTRVNWVNYVADITDDVDDRSSLFRSIIVDNAPDTNNVGDYQVSIYCVDSDGNASVRQILTVHITE